MAPKPPVRIPSLPTRRAGRARVPVVRFQSHRSCRSCGPGRPPAGGVGARAEGHAGGAGPPEELKIGSISPNFAPKTGGFRPKPRLLEPILRRTWQESPENRPIAFPSSRPWVPVTPLQPSGIPPQTISLRAFSGSARTTLRAGLAGIVIGAPVKGFVLDRAVVAGLRTTLSFRSPGRTNWPGPFLPSSWAMSAPRAAKTAATCFVPSPVVSASAV